MIGTVVQRRGRPISPPPRRVTIRRRAAAVSSGRGKSEGCMRPFLVALVLIAGTMPAAAQWLDRSWPGIPRTADGKPNLTAPAPRGPDGKPDLTGVWEGSNVVARPDPASLQPWVLDLARQHQQEYYKGRPFYQCRPSGPEAERFGGWKRILQTH